VAAVKRVFWGMLGVGFGAVVGASAVRWASRTAERLTPTSLGQRSLDAAGEWRRRLAAAVDEGREAMAAREAELRALYAEPGDEAT
jgi:hypothetical protein